MRTTHLRIRGRGLLKMATKLKPNFARSNSTHHVTLTLILLHAKGNASVSLNIRTMKSMMRICTHNSAIDTTQIPKFKSMIDEHIAHGHELKRHTRRSGDRGECGLHY